MMKKTLLFKLLAISIFTLFSVKMTNAQVFMTELADPNNDATLRYIELYNAGTTAVNFTEGSGWHIDKYTNASATVSQTLALTGTIPAGGFYIIATGAANSNFFTIYGIAANQFDGAADNVAGSNGDDNLELYNGTNTLIDQFGLPGQDGTGTNHEFEDGRAERIASVVTAQSVYADANWTTWSDGPTAPAGDIIATKDAPADFDPGKWIGHIEAIDVIPPTFTATPTQGDIDVAINTPIVLTFDEAIRNINDSEITNANVADLLTLKETDATGAVVAFTATIDAAKKVITATPTAVLKNSQVYYAAIVPVEDGANNATTQSSMTFTTIAASAATISDVAITETAPYYAGDAVTITWVSSNVTSVMIEAWIPDDSKWDVLFASIPSDGTEAFTIPVDAPYSATYKIRVTDVANAAVTAESGAFTVIAVAKDLLALRAQPVGAMVKYTGIATVTFSRPATTVGRNQKYIQDAKAAVLIDDMAGFITGTYSTGNGITNIVGKIVLYNGLIEFTPTEATGEPATGIEIVPEIRTLASLKPDDQCKLVKIENFAFKNPAEFDVTGKFIAGKNYEIDGIPKSDMAYRTAFAESDYIGGIVPTGTMSSICLVGQYTSPTTSVIQMQITARSWSDMTLPFELPKLVITEIMYTSPDVSAKQEWVELYNNGTTSVDMGGFYILDSDPLHKADPIVLPAGAVIAPGDYFTIETSDNGQPELFPFVPDFVSIKFNFGKADEVKLFHSNGQLIDSVSYNSVAPWPTSPNGGGSSLTLCDPNLDNSLASSWEASEDVFTTLQSTTIKATPGTGCILHTAVAPGLQKGINVYPNPTSDNLYISNPANERLEITILSSLGKPVKSVKSNQGLTSVDLSDLPKGIYMIKMLNKTSEKTQMQKVVVK